MKRLSPLTEVIGVREIVALCGMLVLTVSLGFYDWRLAGAVLGGLLVTISIGPYVLGLLRATKR